MKIIFDKACHVEDRRVETSLEKRSLLVKEKCPRCSKTFVYIIAAEDASLVTDWCSRCRANEGKP